MMAGSSKDELRVPAAKCEENGFGVDGMPCMFSVSSDSKVYHYANLSDSKLSGTLFFIVSPLVTLKKSIPVPSHAGP
jgi:hypothetical protein